MTIQYHSLLQGLGDALGIPDMAFEGNTCTLLVENTHPLSIVKDETRQCLILSGVTANELPDPLEHGLAEFLLQTALNPMFGSGPAIGLDPESGLLVAYAVLDCRDLTPEDVGAAGLQFLTFQMLAAERIRTGSTPPQKNIPAQGAMPV